MGGPSKGTAVREIEVRPVSQQVVAERPLFVQRLVDPAHLLAMAFGLALIVMALVALVRTGLPSGSWTEPVVMVGWLAHTPLLALIHLVAGAMLAAAGAAPVLERSGELTIATIAGVFGVVLLIEPSAFSASLATSSTHGSTYLVGAVALFLAAELGPLRRTTRVR